MRRVIYEEAMDGISISRIIRNYEYSMPNKHTHAEYEIYYLVSGERTYFIENRVYHVTAGSLVFINSNSIHMTSQCGESYHERIVIELLDEPLGRLLGTTGELSPAEFFRTKQGVIQLEPKEQQYVLALFDGIASEIAAQNPGYRFMATAKIARLLFFALRCRRYVDAADTVALSTSATHQKVTEVASYISENCAQAGSLDNVARHFYMSKSYLSRVFKEYTGYTVNEYINVNRIQKARQLLAESDLNITEIAEVLGYESLTYFEKIFRKHTETSPLKYRRKYRRQRETAGAAVRPQSFIGEQL